MPKVRMYHPPSNRYQDASQDAFERVWQAEGWVLDETPPEPAPKTKPVKKAAAASRKKSGG